MKFIQRVQDKGVGIIVVLLALMVLGSVAGAMILISSGQMIAANSNHQGQEALYAARAGAYIRLGQLRSDQGDLSPKKGTMKKPGVVYEAEVFEGPDTARGIPDGCYLVESTGMVTESVTGRIVRTRTVEILATLTASRWNHAAFGNDNVTMKAGSYTASWDSSQPTLPVKDYDHSKASIATNNPKEGIVIEDKNKVVIGWDNSLDASTGKRKKKKRDEDKELKPNANVMGPPGSVEKNTVKGDMGDDKAYKDFVTASQQPNMDPVEVPTLPAGPVGAIDTTLSPFPTVDVLTGPTLIPPGAYYDLNVSTGGIATLDVSALTPGSTAEYTFRGINLTGGVLQVQQPPPPAEPITVKVYLDTGMGSNVDDDAGVFMEGASVINPSSKPIHLQFLIAGEGTSFLEGSDGDLGSPEAYYVAYAPQASLSIKKGALYGSIVANEVVLEGDSDALTATDKLPAVIHFDVSLLEDTDNPPMFNIISVRYR